MDCFSKRCIIQDNKNTAIVFPSTHKVAIGIGCINFLPIIISDVFNPWLSAEQRLSELYLSSLEVFEKEQLFESLHEVQKEYTEIKAEHYMNRNCIEVLLNDNNNTFNQINYRVSSVVEKIKKETKTEKMSTYIWLLFWLYIYSKKRVRTRRWACFQIA